MDLNDGINYIKLDKKAKGCMRVNAAFIWIILASAATVSMVIFWDGGIVRNLVIAACWIWATVYVIAVPTVRYERYRYCIDNESIRVIEGFMWISEQVVPIERLHKISKTQGPVARMFGLSTVKVTTAGMAELADVQDLGSCAARRVGSTPTTRTTPEQALYRLLRFFVCGKTCVSSVFSIAYALRHENFFFLKI